MQPRLVPPHALRFQFLQSQTISPLFQPQGSHKSHASESPSPSPSVSAPVSAPEASTSLPAQAQAQAPLRVPKQRAGLVLQHARTLRIGDARTLQLVCDTLITDARVVQFVLEPLIKDESGAFEHHAIAPDANLVWRKALAARIRVGWFARMLVDATESISLGRNVFGSRILGSGAKYKEKDGIGSVGAGALFAADEGTDFFADVQEPPSAHCGSCSCLLCVCVCYNCIALHCIAFALHLHLHCIVYIVVSLCPRAL